MTQTLWWQKDILRLLFAVAALFVWNNHFLQDDAFISFIYARNFAQGQGLVWAPGSTEFGYTSFLYTLLIGLGMKAGIAPELFSYAIGTVAFLVTTVLVIKIGRNFDWPPAGIIAGIALITNQTFSAYATGGLETSLQTCLILAAYYCYFYQKNVFALTGFAVLALLTRLDSALLLLPLYVSLLRSNRRAFLKASLPPLICVAAFLMICQSYYGQALPNSFTARITLRPSASWGLTYFVTYVTAQLFTPLIVALVFFRRRIAPEIRPMLAALLLWIAYIFFIGGDFMAFRFLVPVLPFYYLIAVSFLTRPGTKQAHNKAVLLALLLLLGNVSERYYTSHYMPNSWIEPVSRLKSWVQGWPVNWRDAGQALEQLFNTGSKDDVKIAVAPAGAIPFYSHLPAFDQRGLNSRAVFDDQISQRGKPGHRAYASIDLMAKERVNLILDHPVFVVESEGEYGCLPGQNAIADPNDLLIPVKPRFYVLAYYLSPHPAVERLIRNGKILRWNDLGERLHCGYKRGISAH